MTKQDNKEFLKAIQDSLPKPINGHLLVERAYKPGGLIIVPERYRKHMASNCRIIDRALDCDLELTNGEEILHQKKAEGSEVWKHPRLETVELIHQGQVEGIVRGGRIFPLGDRILVEKLDRDPVLSAESAIILPSNPQAPWAKVVAIGTCKMPPPKGLQPGHTVRISWQAESFQLLYQDRHHLIVRYSAIDFYLNRK